MTTVNDIVNFIDSFAPFNTAMDFDNVGLLIGDISQNISTCVVALDVTNDVIEEAKNVHAELIITHHPVIFQPIKKLSSASFVYTLAKNNISVISAHTNLDMSNFGVNSCLANNLDLINLYPLSNFITKDEKQLPLGLIGEIQTPLDCINFAKFVKNKLNCKNLRYTNINKTIKKIAVCSGAGGNLIYKAIENNVDAFLTGEIKHHEILLANKNNICVVDVGHFKSENVIISPLIKKLSDKFTNINFIESKFCSDNINYL